MMIMQLMNHRCSRTFASPMMRMLAASSSTGMRMDERPKVLSISQCATSYPHRPSQLVAVKDSLVTYFWSSAPVKTCETRAMRTASERVASTAPQTKRRLSLCSPRTSGSTSPLPAMLARIQLNERSQPGCTVPFVLFFFFVSPLCCLTLFFAVMFLSFNAGAKIRKNSQTSRFSSNYFPLSSVFLCRRTLRRLLRSPFGYASHDGCTTSLSSGPSIGWTIGLFFCLKIKRKTSVFLLRFALFFVPLQPLLKSLTLYYCTQYGT